MNSADYAFRFLGVYSLRYMYLKEKRWFYFSFIKWNRIFLDIIVVVSFESFSTYKQSLGYIRDIREPVSGSPVL